MITFVGVGASANANYQTAANPAIPAGVAAGDLLLCLSIARSTANNVLASSWTQLSVVDTNNFFVLASYRIAAGGDAAPTITPAGMSSGQTHISRVTAWRGVDPVRPFGPIGAGAQTDSATNVGPIATPASIADDGAVIVLGSRLGTWTGAAVLTGSLTWLEAWDENTAVANVFAWAMDYTIWSGGIPPLTQKTFTITGGVASSVIGQMWSLNALKPPPQHRRRVSAMPFPPFP